MDEILYPGPRPETEEAEAVRRDWRREAQEKVNDLLFRWDASREKRRLPARLFLLVALLSAVVTTVTTVYTHGYEVTVDGTHLGIVA